MNDGIKIRKDAINLQQNDITDTLESIENETNKTIAVLAFEGLLVVESLTFVDQKAWIFKITLVVVVAIAAFTAIMSLFSKKVDIHTDVNELFVRKDANDDFNDYLDNKHLRLNGIYQSAQALLRNKVALTKATFVSLAAAIITLLTGVFI